MILQKDGLSAEQAGGQVGKTISHYRILEKLGEARLTDRHGVTHE